MSDAVEFEKDRNSPFRVAQVAQSVECLTLDFSSGRDPRVIELSLVSGSGLGVETT